MRTRSEKINRAVRIDAGPNPERAVWHEGVDHSIVKIAVKGGLQRALGDGGLEWEDLGSTKSAGHTVDKIQDQSLRYVPHFVANGATKSHAARHLNRSPGPLRGTVGSHVVASTLVNPNLKSTRMGHCSPHGVRWAAGPVGPSGGGAEPRRRKSCLFFAFFWRVPCPWVVIFWCFPFWEPSVGVFQWRRGGVRRPQTTPNALGCLEVTLLPGGLWPSEV